MHQSIYLAQWYVRYNIISRLSSWVSLSWQAAPDGNTEYVRAMPLSTSSSANFPKALPHAAQESEEHSVAPMRAMQPMLSPENQEKAPGWGPHGARQVRLQIAVRSFVQQATRGMRIEVLEEAHVRWR